MSFNSNFFPQEIDEIIGTFKDSKSIPKNHQLSFLQQRAPTLGNVL